MKVLHTISIPAHLLILSIDIAEEEKRSLVDALGETAAAEIELLCKHLPAEEAAELRDLECRAAKRVKLGPSSTDKHVAQKALHPNSTAQFMNMECCCKSRVCQRGAVGSDVLKDFKWKLFGDEPEEAVRRKRYHEILLTAWNRKPGTRRFIFYIGPFRVCEVAFRVACGIHGAPSRMWAKVKRAVKDGMDPCVPQLNMQKMGSRSKKIDFIKVTVFRNI